MTSLNSMFNTTLVGRLLKWKQGDEDDAWKGKALEVLKKKINRAGQMENLRSALKHKKETTPCVTLDRSKDGRLQVMHRKMLPHVMYCRIFRWPDLQSQHELRSVSSCQWPAHLRELQEICVNPYHYTRVDHPSQPPVVARIYNDYSDASPPSYSPMSPEGTYSPQQPSPPYMTQPSFQQPNSNYPYNYFATGQPQPQTSSQTNYHANLPTFHTTNNLYGEGPLLFMGGATSEENMQPTGSDLRAHSSPLPAYSDRGNNISIPMDINDDRQQVSELSAVDKKNCWCEILYFELNHRVGGSFPKSAPLVTVDGGTAPESHNRFALGALSNPNRSRALELIRNSIGKGITLENDGAQIYVTNMSDYSVFFCSKICNIENQLNRHAVVKVEPGRRQKMFDHKIFEDLLHEALQSQENRNSEQVYSLLEHVTIRLSFVKGWGSIYKRQDATATPCWIEIHLLKCYELLDQYLQEVKPKTKITSTS